MKGKTQMGLITVLVLCAAWLFFNSSLILFLIDEADIGRIFWLCSFIAFCLGVYLALDGWVTADNISLRGKLIRSSKLTNLEHSQCNWEIP